MWGIKKEEGRETEGFAVFSIAVFMILLVLPTIVWLVMGMVWQEGRKQLDYDLDENRNKAAFPQSFGMIYGEEIEKYYNDRLPFRSLIILADRKLTVLAEKPYDDVLEPCLVKMFYDDFERQETSEGAGEKKVESDEGNSFPKEEEDTDYFPPKIHNKATIEGREKWLFFAGENSLEDYVGSNILSQEQLDSFLSGMENLGKICSEKGKQLFLFIPPNKEQVYSEFMPDYKIVNDYKRAQRLADYVQANSDIKIIYPLKELKAAKEQWQLYFKTDTHWNSAGAFIGTQALYSLMGLPTTDLADLTAEKRKFDSGDLIRMGNLDRKDYEEEFTYTIYYKLYVDVSMEIGEGYESAICSTVSNSENQSSLVMVGDSFRISMGQFLSKDFGRCTLIDALNMTDEAAAALRNADIIVMESLERTNEDLPRIMDSIGNILECE